MYKRIRTIEVKGISLQYYNYGENCDIYSFSYRRSYTSRISLEKMLANLSDEIDGELHFTSLGIDCMLEIAKDTFKITRNEVYPEVPEKYAFTGHINKES